MPQDGCCRKTDASIYWNADILLALSRLLLAPRKLARVLNVNAATYFKHCRFLYFSSLARRCIAKNPTMTPDIIIKSELHMTKTIAALAAFTACMAMPSVAQAKVYAEVHGGYDDLSIAGLSAGGAAYGGALGYEHKIGKTMFAAIDYSVDGATGEVCVVDQIVIGDEACVRPRADVALVAKFGTALSEKSEIYLLGGRTNASFKYSYDDGVDPFTDSFDRGAWRVGAGVKLKLSGKIFAKAEYRYSDYGRGGYTRSNGLVALGTAF